MAGTAERTPEHLVNRSNHPFRGPRTSSMMAAIGVALITLSAAPRAVADSDTSSDNRAPEAVDAASTASSDSFDPSFLVGGARQGADLTRFAQANSAAPGKYRVDIWLNEDWKAVETVEFRNVDGQLGAQPCYTAALLLKLGVDAAKVATATGTPTALPEGEICGDPGRYLTDARMTFDSSENKLTFSVPQIYLRRHSRGYVDPALWDDGINAVVANYNFNVFESDYGDGRSRSAFLGLDVGANFGAWRIRHSGSLSWDQNSTRYESSRAYAQRDIKAWKSQLVLGESYTDGRLFDSFSLRGARLFSDDRMLPDSMNGYAPSIRGVARTNAKVTVRQRDNVVYETTVAPGPFKIDDLYATGYSGDLSVTVTEADGQQSEFVVPYTSVAQLLRAGQARYDVSVGRLNERELSDVWVTQGTYQRGLNDSFTGYGGVIIADGYNASMLGMATSTLGGAFSLDVTRSQTDMPVGNGSKSGFSARLSYSKNFTATETNVALAAYRYSTDGYMSLLDAVRMQSEAHDGDYVSSSPRSRFDLTANQPLGDGRGNFYATGSATRYRDRNDDTISVSAGYNSSWRALTYGLSAQRIRTVATGQDDMEFTLNLTLPLGRAARAPSLSAIVTGGDRNQQLLSFNGTADEDRRLTYGGTASFAEGGNNAVGVNAAYTGSIASVSGSYSRSSDYQQLSLGSAGGLVIHADGVTLSQSLGGTVGLVEVPGGKGAGVRNNYGVRVDSRGYALVPYLSPYQLNTVEIDPKGASAAFELLETTRSVAPTDGAVIRIPYETKHGQSALLQLQLEDGRPAPFGADVYDDQGEQVGIVGQAGRAIVRLADGVTSGDLILRWGDQRDLQCRVPYQLAKQSRGSEQMQRLEGICKPESAFHSASASR